MLKEFWVKLKNKFVEYKVDYLLAMFLAVCIFISFFMTVAIGSAYKIETYSKLFTYIACIVSIELLIISLFNLNKKEKVKNNKMLGLVIIIFLAIFYAVSRFVIFPNVPQFEDPITVIVLLISYLDMVNKK